MERRGGPPQQAIDAANKFYSVDRPLSTEQREQLSSAFQSQQWAIPTGALTLMTIGIVAPRYAARYGYINRPVTQTRLLSALLGLPGFAIGGRVGYGMAYSHNRGRLDDGSNAQQAFDMLANYPPQIGLAYYKTTARDPAYVMKDPNTIDWKREPPFPMNLVRSTMMASRSRSGPPQQQQQQQNSNDESSWDQYASYSNDKPPEPSFYEPGDDTDGNMNSNYANNNANGNNRPPSSWDSIRRANDNSNSQTGSFSQPGSYTQSSVGSSSSPSGGGSFSGSSLPGTFSTSSQPAGSLSQGSIGSFGGGTLSSQTSQTPGSFSQSGQTSSGSLTPIPPPPALSGPPRLQAETDAAYEDQKRFDEQLERERMGYSSQDDFSDSEKQWQSKDA